MGIPDVIVLRGVESGAWDISSLSIQTRNCAGKEHGPRRCTNRGNAGLQCGSGSGPGWRSSAGSCQLPSMPVPTRQPPRLGRPSTAAEAAPASGDRSSSVPSPCMVRAPRPPSDATFGQSRGAVVCAEPSPARPCRAGVPRSDREAGTLQAWLFAASSLPWQHLLWGFFLLFLTAPYVSVSKQWRLHTDCEPSPSLPPSSLSPEKPQHPQGWSRVHGPRANTQDGHGESGQRARGAPRSDSELWGKQEQQAQLLAPRARRGEQHSAYIIITNNKHHVGLSDGSLGRFLKYKAQPCPTNPRLFSLPKPRSVKFLIAKIQSWPHSPPKPRPGSSEGSFATELQLLAKSARPTGQLSARGHVLPRTPALGDLPWHSHLVFLPPAIPG